ncbi:MAG TPA: YHYH protein [Candidatus Saccharimonadales bacterium]|nr:YHYH protein [Candidatus Saccharimonadales bacterium]
MQNGSNGMPQSPKPEIPVTPEAAPETKKTNLGPTDTPQAVPVGPTPAPAMVVSGGQGLPHRNLWIALAVVVALLLAGTGYWFGLRSSTAKTDSTATKTSTTTSPKTTGQSGTAQGVQLDTTKKYGDKYADGLLPVGDGKYSTTAAKKGTVYACSQYATNLTSDKGGADTRGPWFVNNNTQYDVTKKVHVLGSVPWQPSFSNTVNGGTRTITTNDLPSHVTGVFPIASNDPAYTYDRNPNTISGQTLSYALSASPTYSATPNCMGGEVGVMLTGVALFNAFDAGGRDAGAWEVQDNCGGHPQSSGEYHYHTLSSCIKDISVKTVIGFALDGFPITGPQVGTGNILTTDDLDECHGLTSAITLDGKTVTTYHYVMTQDFPYSASCFRSKAANPPGAQEGTSGQSQPPQGGTKPPAGSQPPH